MSFFGKELRVVTNLHSFNVVQQELNQDLTQSLYLEDVCLGGSLVKRRRQWSSVSNYTESVFLVSTRYDLTAMKTDRVLISPFRPKFPLKFA